MKKKKILILGATGMIGHVLFNELNNYDNYEVYGTARRNLEHLIGSFPKDNIKRLRPNVEATNFDTIMRALASVQPDIVINCIGIIKQAPLSNDPLSIITTNAQLPHRISMVCRTANARMIQMSTDCIFRGDKGFYKEEDIADATDLYGRTKYLGEVTYPHCITIRTSTIGHEIKGGFGLLEWFLNQKKSIKGFKNAIFSGFPTVELAKIIGEYIIPNDKLKGVYHISSNPISKYDLLKIISKVYNYKIDIVPNYDFKVDRSLNSEKFKKETGYKVKNWEDLIDDMYSHYKKYKLYRKYYDFDESSKYWENI